MSQILINGELHGVHRNLGIFFRQELHNFSRVLGLIRSEKVYCFPGFFKKRQNQPVKTGFFQGFQVFQGPWTPCGQGQK